MAARLQPSALLRTWPRLPLSCPAVAAGVLRSSVFARVAVEVTEIPCLALEDQSAAPVRACTHYGAGRDERLPPHPQTPMVAVVELSLSRAARLVPMRRRAVLLVRGRRAKPRAAQLAPPRQELGRHVRHPRREPALGPAVPLPVAARVKAPTATPSGADLHAVAALPLSRRGGEALRRWVAARPGRRLPTRVGGRASRHPPDRRHPGRLRERGRPVPNAGASRHRRRTRSSAGAASCSRRGRRGRPDARPWRSRSRRRCRARSGRACAERVDSHGAPDPSRKHPACWSLSACATGRSGSPDPRSCPATCRSPPRPSESRSRTDAARCCRPPANDERRVPRVPRVEDPAELIVHLRERVRLVDQQSRLPRLDRAEQRS
jgi:hypothetical protein